ncbi:MAG: hypothetical protein JSV04_09595 [Candidatus Heimdallarchaeota archaeon]|nr:MAG: hypothetical protein JSV04_09595 [Candidatus Heimdallarchaeota archaeon]
MAHFLPPESDDFYDERLIISWKLIQPPHLSNLKNITIRISGNPPLKFSPLQAPELQIPALNDNEVIVNWIIQKPVVKTEVILSIHCDIISEEYSLFINLEK